MVNKRNIVARVEELAQPIAIAIGLEIVDVEYVKEGSKWYLRVFIDKPGGVSLDDCQELSTALSDILDAQDLISHSYMLEVSSPGIERPLKKPEDYKRFIGKKVLIRTYTPLDGRKKFTGQLLGFDNGEIQLEVDNKRILIPLEKVSKANLSVEF
ncbi:MAG: ribosome maturation factor RimP [Desulfotomaculum sp.]|nr:ribosome maturation factor RimP [Desulfotomaculum sp.]MCL0042024.1 ribosome maturation factor RimP [Peptococcaceae bacterium]